MWESESRSGLICTLFMKVSYVDTRWTGKRVVQTLLGNGKTKGLKDWSVDDWTNQESGLGSARQKSIEEEH